MWIETMMPRPMAAAASPAEGEGAAGSRQTWTPKEEGDLSFAPQVVAAAGRGEGPEGEGVWTWFQIGARLLRIWRGRRCTHSR